MQLLMRGGQSKIYTFTDEKNKTLVVKIGEDKDLTFEEYIRGKCLAGIPQVIDFLNYDGTCIFMQPYEGNIRQGKFTLEEKKFIITETLIGLHAIHKRGFCHGDFKGDNVLFRRVEGKIEVVIIDFGNTNYLGYSPNCCCTEAYAPPEKYMNEKSDIYCWGLMVAQLWGIQEPFSHIISMCVNHEPDLRPSCTTLLASLDRANIKLSNPPKPDIIPSSSPEIDKVLQQTSLSESDKLTVKKIYSILAAGCEDKALSAVMACYLVANLLGQIFIPRYRIDRANSVLSDYKISMVKHPEIFPLLIKEA